MTLDEMKQSTKVFVSASDIAPILGCDPQCIRRQAQIEPNALSFPILRLGSRIRIPRIPFLRFIGEL